MTGHEDISRWPPELEAVIAGTPGCCVDRVIVMRSTPSTMDAALTRAENRPGLLLVASEQTRGRGRLGRPWRDAPGMTLPCTFVIGSGGVGPAVRSSIAACAVHEAISSFAPSSARVLIKWPNDIVVREGDTDRKLAGILIEQKGPLTLIGVGINCFQRDADFEPGLRRRATSLGALGATVSRLELLCTLVGRLSAWSAAGDATAIRHRFELHDAMAGTRRVFRHDQRLHEGIVEHLDPLASIVLRTQTGTITLPIAQTTHVGGGDPDAPASA